MIYRESRFKRNGVPVAVQYLTMSLSGKHAEMSHQHYHDYTELLFGITGRPTVAIGNRRFELGEGEMIIIRNEEPHDVFSSEPCTYHVLKFLPQILLTEEQTYSEYSYVLMLLENLPSKELFFCKEELEKTEVPQLFSRIRREWEQQAFGYELSLRADVTRIFLFILRSWQNRDPAWAGSFVPAAQQRELISRAIEHVRQNYADLTEEETAAACGVSPAYLSRSFHRCMRISFSAYVNNLRLRESERLLLTTNNSITDIAQAVGFSTSAYFIAKFREAHGITPHRYRRQQEDGAAPSESEKKTT
ncbi:MAG: helix-turn-helix domain-containing protein [Ruminococcaceae bacterium]|nr:helix-turn-helix domain-containing protein [Oscillospiraceae bacterium]